MNQIYMGLKPTELWRHFAILNGIPRCSGRETAARTYVQQVADALGAIWKVDEGGNTVIYVPAKGADPHALIVAVQAHLDMVCEKRPDVIHNFAEDAIRPRRDGDWVFASGTTLGADNGIGVAAALALLTEPDLRHGPLELVFTIKEETGLEGALALDPALINARLLVNLDSENPNELTVGSAGAADGTINVSLPAETTPDGWVGREIVISGLKGGHSGVQINERHANAIKLLTNALITIRDTGVNFRLGSMEGGTVRNAIPRDAAAQLSLAPDIVAELEMFIPRVSEALLDAWGTAEPGLTVDVREIPPPKRALVAESRDLLLRLLADLPHGCSRPLDSLYSPLPCADLVEDKVSG